MSDIGPVNRAAHLRAPFPWLRHQIKVAALSLQGDGEDHHAARLRDAFDRFAETLTGEGLFEALHPDDERLFAELPADEQRLYAEAAATLRGESADPPP